MSAIVAQAAEPATQAFLFTLAAVAMVFAGVGKRRLEWRPPRKPQRRGWFGRRPRSSR
jgi:hypothetical protein